MHLILARIENVPLFMQGHSVTRKLNSVGGKVDTTQTLHNLNEGLFPGLLTLIIQEHCA